MYVSLQPGIDARNSQPGEFQAPRATCARRGDVIEDTLKGGCSSIFGVKVRGESRFGERALT